MAPGRPLGILIGVAVIGVLDAGLIFEGLGLLAQSIAKGMVLLLALGADQVVQRMRDAGGLAPWLAALRSRPSRAAARRWPPAQRARGPAALQRLDGLRRTDGAFGPVVLEAEGLTRHYGAVTALAEAELRVRAGEIVCLLGDNGAGSRR